MIIELLFSLVLIGGPAISTVQDSAKVTDYSVAFVRFEVSPAKHVVDTKAGLLCLPAGSLRWRSVPLPGERALLDAIAAGLERAGVDVLSPTDAIFDDEPASTPFRIVAIVRDMKLSVCGRNSGFPGWSGIDRSVLRGKGRLKVEWQVHARASRAVVASYEIDQPFSFADQPGGLEAAVATAIAENAARLGERLSPGPDH